MIKEIIEKYLDKTSILEKASRELGDRTSYIGSSDIGSCPRKVYLTKKGEFVPSLQDLIKFTRGHMFEPIVAEVFKLAGYKYESQKELIHPDYPYVQAHIDFFFYNKNMTKIRVVELKTVSVTPESAYPNWVDQVQYQLGTTKAVYPSADIKGSILVINVANGEIKEFNGMEPIDSVYETLLERAKFLMDTLKGEEPDPEIGLYCVWCPFRQQCPAFTGDEVNLPKEVVDEIKSYTELNNKKKEIEQRLKEKKEQLIKLLGVGYKGKVDGYRISISEVVNERLDTKTLKAEMPEIYEQFKKAVSFIKFDVRASA